MHVECCFSDDENVESCVVHTHAHTHTYTYVYIRLTWGTPWTQGTRRTQRTLGTPGTPGTRDAGDAGDARTPGALGTLGTPGTLAVMSAALWARIKDSWGSLKHSFTIHGPLSAAGPDRGRRRNSAVKVAAARQAVSDNERTSLHTSLLRRSTQDFMHQASSRSAASTRLLWATKVERWSLD